MDIHSFQTKSFQCTSPRKNGPKDGKILIQKYNQAYISKKDIHFVNPRIEDFTPKLGPVSGGTIVNITGQFYHGGNIRAFFGNTKCIEDAIENNATQFRCKTSKYSKYGKYNEFEDFDTLLMELGNYPDTKRRWLYLEFRFENDPKITSVSSHSTKQEPPNGPLKGGTDIYVKGTNFHVIQHPQFYVIFNNKAYNSECKSKTNETMIFESPRFVEEMSNFHSEEPSPLEYGFIMDGVESVNDFSKKNPNFSKFILTPNPRNPPEPPDSQIWWIALSVFLAIGIICVGIYAGCTRRALIKEREKFRIGNPSQIDKEKPLNDQAHLLSYDEKYEYPRDQLVLHNKLGNGKYGNVYKGVPNQRFYGEDEIRAFVAVKMGDPRTDKVR